MKLQGQAKSFLFLGFISVLFCMEYARQQYNKKEGFSKASDAAKMTGKIILFIVLLIIFYGFAAFIANSMAGSGGNQGMIPIIGLLVTAPGALAYYLAFVLIN
jgi:uncharacterized membrane protein